MAPAALVFYANTCCPDEIQSRRSHILGTIGSVQAYIVTQYISGTLQCRLGYDSSPACDDFQLGQMLRYFNNKGLISGISSTLAGSSQEVKPYAGEMADLMQTFKQCPSYQVDNNHKYCGFRSRTRQAFEIINPSQQAGVCLPCWRKNKDKESWQNPVGGTWSWVNEGRWGERPGYHHCEGMSPVKAMYTADERDWSYLLGR